MNVKNIAICLLVIYALISPILIIRSESNGFREGYDLALFYNQQTSPLWHYRVGDTVINSHDYFNNSNGNIFIGEIKTISKEGILVVYGIDKLNPVMHMMIINEYWTEPAIKGD